MLLYVGDTTMHQQLKRGDNNLIIDTIRELQEPRFQGTDANPPIEFKEVKDMFQKAMLEDKRVLIEHNELNLAHSVVVELEYIGERWCMGKTVYYQNNVEVRVPYTIHYSDIYTAKTTNSTSRNTKIIFEGANPFGKGLREGITEN